MNAVWKEFESCASVEPQVSDLTDWIISPSSGVSRKIFKIQLNMNLFKLISTNEKAQYQTISLSGTLRLTFVPFCTDISQRLLNKLTWDSPIDNLLPLMAPCKLGVSAQWGSVTLCHSSAPNCLAAVSVKTPEVASQTCWQQSLLWTVVSRDCFLVKHKARPKMTASSC